MAELDDRNARNAKVIEEFRSGQGRVAGRENMMLLTHTGAKSGKRRTNPLAYLPDNGRVVLFASKGGGPTNPDWYHNLVANPIVTVEAGAETYQARAVVVTGKEREELFARQVKAMPVFGEYQVKTPREIPVIVLERI
ncbi:MAG: nitroreductase family deazaflavin-dependent oxidoreductase [Dehalococcoidia bacterium]|nr:nitroreductase family deazaflavin-dependent oxidoreductase [Dehalococcoidia bacterium]